MAVLWSNRLGEESTVVSEQRALIQYLPRVAILAVSADDPVLGSGRLLAFWLSPFKLNNNRATGDWALHSDTYTLTYLYFFLFEKLLWHTGESVAQEPKRCGFYSQLCHILLGTANRQRISLCLSFPTHKTRIIVLTSFGHFEIYWWKELGTVIIISPPLPYYPSDSQSLKHLFSSPTGQAVLDRDLRHRETKSLFMWKSYNSIH